VARRANGALWARRSAVGLVGSAIDALDGNWRTAHSGIGGGIDSWLEYLPKAAIVLNDEGLQAMADEALAAVAAHTDFGGVNLEVGSSSGRAAPRLPATISALQTFFPGVEVLTGAVASAQTRKEASTATINTIVQRSETWGHSEVVLQADGEPSTRALVRAVPSVRQHTTLSR
jgi:hypothetical protein